MYKMLQEFIAPRLVVSIQFAIRGDQDQLCLSALAFALRKVIGQVTGGEEVGIAGRIPVERDAARQGRIVEKDGDAAPIQQAHNVRLGWVYRRSCLPGSQDSIAHTILCQQVKR